MSPDVLRRKLQKKLKHKPFRKCPGCGQRMRLRLIELDGRWRLFKCCGDFRETWGPTGVMIGCKPVTMRGRINCGHFEELFWSGGGKADTYPTE